jgi:DNA-binding transcriptional ArsR family regulator
MPTTKTASRAKNDRAAAPARVPRRASQTKVRKADEDLPTDIFALIGKSENIEQAAIAMQAMSHPLRIKILCLLSSGELIVQDIVDAVGTTQSNISQHLGILKASGMIDSRKDGTKMFYALTDERIMRMISLTRDIFCAA